MDMRYVGWRWAGATPFLLLAALSTLGALSGTQAWTAGAYLLILVLPALLGLATLFAPAGGWLIVVGLASGIAGGFGVVLVLGIIGFLGSIGGSPSGQSFVLFWLAFVPVVAAVGTILTGVSELDRVRRAHAHQGAGEAPRHA